MLCYTIELWFNQIKNGRAKKREFRTKVSGCMLICKVSVF